MNNFARRRSKFAEFPFIIVLQPTGDERIAPIAPNPRKAEFI
jgi:hypothetical protein